MPLFIKTMLKFISSNPKYNKDHPSMRSMTVEGESVDSKKYKSFS